jgi:hypothetical protein
MNSVFFWSGEEARTHRAESPIPRGIYLTLRQGAIIMKPAQSILVGFDR